MFIGGDGESGLLLSPTFVSNSSHATVSNSMQDTVLVPCSSSHSPACYISCEPGRPSAVHQSHRTPLRTACRACPSAAHGCPCQGLPIRSVLSHSAACTCPRPLPGPYSQVRYTPFFQLSLPSLSSPMFLYSWSSISCAMACLTERSM